VQASAAYAQITVLVEELYAAERISLRFARYLGSPQELWARSYAQWVAVNSGSARLKAELDSAREHWYADTGPYLYEQWDDQDFVPLALALDALFASGAQLSAPVGETPLPVLPSNLGLLESSPLALAASTASDTVFLP
jgi:hypothetical protein